MQRYYYKVFGKCKKNFKQSKHLKIVGMGK